MAIVVAGSSFTKAIRCLAPYQISAADTYCPGSQLLNVKAIIVSDDVFIRLPVCFTMVFVIRDSVFNHEWYLIPPINIPCATDFGSLSAQEQADGELEFPPMPFLHLTLLNPAKSALRQLK